MFSCGVVRKVIAEAARTGTLGNLPDAVRRHLSDCPRCAEIYFADLEVWLCSDVRAYTELYAAKSAAELPPCARFHVGECDGCQRLLEQYDRLDGMLRNVTLSAQAVLCPSIRPERMPRPLTWKLALALAIAALSASLLALSVYRTAERWGWLYSADQLPPSQCAE